MAIPLSADRTAPALLAGRYQLGRRLGQGSSATVYAAADLRLERLVTVKLFDRGIGAAPALRARFRQQATKAARLHHPHVAAVLDAGFEDGPHGRPFVVTEPAGPFSLRDLLERHSRLSPERAAMLARQVASALRYAHEHGVIHANLKPENILVDETGRHTRVVDFSLSFVSAETGAITLDTIARRAAYLAPEQVRGEQVGPAADVYALGALLYELVVGRPPFVGGSPQDTAEKRVHEDALPAGMFEPAIPPGLEAIIQRALERGPGQRWASMERFEAALRQWNAPRPAPPAPQPTGRRGTAPGVGQPAEARRAPTFAAAERRPDWQDRGSGPLGLAVPLLAVTVTVVITLLLFTRLADSFPRLSISPRPGLPDVVGMPLPDAQALARERGLELSVAGDRVTDRVPRGVVVQQSPVSGKQLSPGQPLRVTVSAGVQVPDVRGKTLAAATAALADLGWKVGRVEKGAFPGQQRGTVALQHPPPGELVPGPGELLLGLAE